MKRTVNMPILFASEITKRITFVYTSLYWTSTTACQHANLLYAKSMAAFCFCSPPSDAKPGRVLHLKAPGRLQY